MVQVVKIKNYNLSGKDRIIVDTNVWFWYTYAASNELPSDEAPIRYQIEKYPEFIEKALDIGARLLHSPLILTELAHLVERSEFKLYKEQNGADITIKQFRKIAGVRDRVTKEIKSAWTAISQVSECIEHKADHDLCNKSLMIFKTSYLDVFDSIYVELSKVYNATAILTDDKDFESNSDINVITARNY